jgi:hypothetical protein
MSDSKINIGSVLSRLCNTLAALSPLYLLLAHAPASSCVGLKPSCSE